MGIAGCRWYLQINGRRNSSAAGLANSYVYPFFAMAKVPIGSPAFNSSLVPTGGRLCGPNFCLVTHCTQERRTYGAMHDRDVS